ncbi:MAG: inorganic phosphate transporter [Clostridia bacterium]|nr:inorganic phosphate transporter [Clostridia bacterium]
MLYKFTFIVIMVLVFINGFTDAPNAITTVVSTNVMSFKKAAFLSAVFNVIGIIVMCLINFAVADGISSIVVLENGNRGLIALSSAMISVIFFSAVASIFGIPTSETHGLIAGLTGSAIVIGNFSNININEWIDVIIGLVWSVLGTWIIVKIIYKLLKKRFYEIKLEKIKKYQKYLAYGLSFVHGAQDGQKFIGVVILFMYIVKGGIIPNNITALNSIWIIVFVSAIMFLGVCIGGKKIVENLGNNTVKLDNVKGIFTDLCTIINLFVASLFGIPVSTTHVKTMSMICLGDETTNKKSVLNIFKAWIWTFPVCFILSYIISKLMYALVF